MKGLNNVVNTTGERTGLLIDLDQLRKMPAKKQATFLEGLNDIITLELRKDEPNRNYPDVRNEILNGKNA